MPVNTAQTISLSDAMSMMGDVAPTVSAADANFAPPARSSSGTTIAALLRGASSEKNTNSFLDEVSRMPDMDYKTFIQAAAKKGVINNPRVLAYSEILKEKHSLAMRDQDIEKNKQLEEEQYKLESTRRTSEDDSKTLFAQEAIERIKTKMGETDTKDIYSVGSKVIREMLNEKKTTDGKEYKSPINSSELMDYVYTPLKTEFEKEEERASKESIAEEARLAKIQQARLAKAEADKTNPSTYEDDYNRSVVAYTNIQNQITQQRKQGIQPSETQLRALKAAELNMNAKAKAMQTPIPSKTKQSEIYAVADKEAKMDEANRLLNILNQNPKSINKERKTKFAIGDKNEKEQIIKMMGEIGFQVEPDKTNPKKYRIKGQQSMGTGASSIPSGSPQTIEDKKRALAGKLKAGTTIDMFLEQAKASPKYANKSEEDIIIEAYHNIFGR